MMRSQTDRFVWVLAIALIAGIALRGMRIASKRTIEHDEGISYIAATGHQGEYDRVAAGAAPCGRWVRASDWARLWSPEDSWCFGRIGRELSTLDIHPPMYFWLLHVWCTGFGVSLAAGPGLNLALSVVSFFVLFLLARALTRDGTLAAVAAAVWFLSPAAIETTSIARQYELFGLLCIALCWATLRCLKAGSISWRLGMFTAFLTGAGALTHHYFALPASGCGLVLVYDAWKRRDSGSFMRVVAAFCGGYLLLAVLHPDFLVALMQRTTEPAAFNSGALSLRLKLLGYTFSSFAWGWRVITWPIVLLLAMVAVAPPIVRMRAGRPSEPRRMPRFAWSMLFVGGWCAVTGAGLYAGFVSPLTAMGPRYLSFVWPAMALFVALVYRLGLRADDRWMVVLCALQFAYGALDVQRAGAEQTGLAGMQPIMDKCDAVVLDNVARGILPTIVWHLDPDKPVFAARQSRLLANVDAWRARFTERSVLVSEMLYADSPRMRDRVIARIEEKHGPLWVGPGVWGVGKVVGVQSGLEALTGPGHSPHSSEADRQ